MTNKTHIKKALLSSMVSLVLCFVMLLGTTFAWFTDTATTAVNTIQSGTLKVDIVDANNTDTSLKNQKLDFVDKNGSTNILWEPGVTFRTQGFKIANKGNLALKYTMLINGITGDAELIKEIDFSIVDANGNAVLLDDFEGNLLKEATSDVLYVQGTMKTTAGNECQGKTITGLGITVRAAQDTVEYDSTTSEYDKDALYRNKISTVSLNDRRNGTVYDNKTVTLDSYDITHTFQNDENNDGKVFYVRNGASMTLNDVDFKAITELDTGKRNFGICLYNGSDLTINSGTYEIEGKWGVLIWAYTDGHSDRNTITINGGTFKSNGSPNGGLIHASDSTDVVINGGFFDASEGNSNVTLQNKSGSIITVTGGTFVNYNPQEHVSEGYKVTETKQADGKTWYTVVAE